MREYLVSSTQRTTFREISSQRLVVVEGIEHQKGKVVGVFRVERRFIGSVDDGTRAVSFVEPEPGRVLPANDGIAAAFWRVG